MVCYADSHLNKKPHMAGLNKGNGRFSTSLKVRPCVTSRYTGLFDAGHTQRTLRPLQVEQFALQRAVAKVRLTELSRLLRV